MTSIKQYQAVQRLIIEALQEGTVPWRKPFGVPGGTYMPHNGKSGRPYRGLNVLNLWLVMAKYGWETPIFLSHRDIEALGGQKKPNQQGNLVFFYKYDDEEDEGQRRSYPIMKMYSVFNIDQTLNVTLPKREEAPAVVPIEEAERILRAFTTTTVDTPRTKPSFNHNGGAKAFYLPRQDSIHLPRQDHFSTVDDYYAVAFHECGHATGHPTRLARFDPDVELAAFGSPDYSKEELVAEFTSAFLCGVSGIHSTIANSTAYIQHWLSRLQSEPRLASSAASAAQKAADFILETFPEQRGLTSQKTLH